MFEKFGIKDRKIFWLEAGFLVFLAYGISLISDLEYSAYEEHDISRFVDDIGYRIITGTFSLAAFADYAITGFELEAIDYLVKPISFERFERSIHKLLKIPQPNLVEVKNYSYFKVSGQLVKVMHHNLLYAQSLKDYILLCTSQGNYVTYMTMKHLADLLPSEYFVRVHRSYLVNKAHVEKIDRNEITIANAFIPVGESYRKTVDNMRW